MTDNHPLHHGKIAHLNLTLPAERIADFFYLLQSGFYIRTRYVGCSVRTFLDGQTGMTDDYISHHISTIFLDGMPVDNVDASVLKHGSRLALSSAMPGLVGATMRQGSPLASLRDSISYKTTGTSEGGEGFVFLKLFNLVMKDLGSQFLQRGILVAPGDLRAFLCNHPQTVQNCAQIVLNGTVCAADRVLADMFSTECEYIQIVLRIKNDAAS
ncbi:MAG TPA: hypothetical protein VLH56_00905 [Dissulfurispiraceae bacterium]|nr:hypothetical protein [Dissulfurispiraceae bacterium]